MNQLNGVTETPYLPENGNGHKSKLKPIAFKWMSDVQPKPVKWLWEPFIPMGMFTLLQGEEGLGKSWIAYALATALAGGHALPFATEATEAGRVLLLTTEDNDEYTIVPRLCALGARRENIAHVATGFPLDDDGVLRLRHLLAEIRPVFVVLDPLTTFIHGDANSEAVVRPALEALNELAREFDCAILGVQHLNKSKGGGDQRKAGNGSIAFRTVARSILLAGKNPDNPHQRALCQLKNSVGAETTLAIGFEIQPLRFELNGVEFDTGRFYWTGESTLTAHQMLCSPSEDEDLAGKLEAVDFLRATLADGERSAADVIAEGKALGLSERQLRYARQKLGIKPKKKDGFFGKMLNQKWQWKLPEGDNSADDCHLQQNTAKQTTYGGGLTEGDKVLRRTGGDCHLQPERDAKVPETAGLAEGDKVPENCHLQAADDKLFETKPERRKSDQPHSFEEPVPRICPCLKCKKHISVLTEICPHCDARQEIPF